MDKRIFIEDGIISLVAYTHSDDALFYDCWLDSETQKGYNGVMNESFEEFSSDDISRFRFYSSVILKDKNETIGVLRLSPPPFEPDLAIWINRPYRYKGYGTHAFDLGLEYCFKTLGLNCIWAGCYENNLQSLSMLKKLGLKRDYQGDTNEVDAFSGEPLKQLSFMISRDEFGIPPLVKDMNA